MHREDRETCHHRPGVKKNYKMKKQKVNNQKQKLSTGQRQLEKGHRTP